MRIFISGISGFIGRHLALAWAREGNKVFGVGFRRNADDLEKFWGYYGGDYDGIHCEEIDILDTTSLTSYVESVKPGFIYHLAAQANLPTARKNPLSTYRLNIEGSHNVLTVANNCPSVKGVHLASSSDVYGPVAGFRQPIKEREPLNGCNPYAISKIAVERIGKYFWQENKELTVIITRLFTTAGVGQYTDAAISYFARQAVRIHLGLQGSVFECGNIDNYRTFLDVDDVVRAFMLLPRIITGFEFEDTVFNITGNEEISLREIVEYLLNIDGDASSVKMEEKGRKSDITRQVGSGSKFHKATGWKPQTSPLRLAEKIYQYWLGESLDTLHGNH